MTVSTIPAWEHHLPMGTKVCLLSHTCSYGDGGGHPVHLSSAKCWGFEEQLLQCLHTIEDSHAPCTSPPVAILCSMFTNTQPQIHMYMYMYIAWIDDRVSIIM